MNSVPEAGSQVELVVKVFGVSNERNVHLHVVRSDDVEVAR